MNDFRRPSILKRSLQLKIAAVLSVVMMVLSCAVVLADTGSYTAGETSGKDAGTAYETKVRYIPGTPPTLTGTYNDTAKPGERVVTYYGNVISTEYNPQVWDYAEKWYQIDSYSYGNTVFIGWKYSGDNGKSWTTDTYDPGDVLRFENNRWYIGNTSEELCGKVNEIYVCAQWGTIKSVRYSGSNLNSTFGNDGSVYTNFYLVNSDVTISAGSNCTIRAAQGYANLVTMSEASFSGNVIIDNVRINTCYSGLGNWHGDAGVGIFANGNTLIFGDGIKSVFSENMSSSSYKLGTVYGGSRYSNSTVDSTKLIFHSGIYSTVVGGGIGQVKNTYTVVNGATVTDTLIGAGKGNVSGDSWVFATGLNMVGDYYEEHYLNTNYLGISDSNGYTYQSQESSIFTGGSNDGSVTNTHVYLSGDSSVWDLQGGGRRGDSTVSGTANIEISGKAVVKHVVNGSITDGNRNYDDKSSVKNVDITVTGDAKVASVYGAGFDTFYEAKYVSMMGSDSKITITIKDGTVGYVYGGGYRGTIGTSTAPLDSININILGGTIIHDVFGGGRGGVDKTCHNPDGTNSWSESAYDFTGHSEVYAKSLNIRVSGGKIQGSIYGGGESVPWMGNYNVSGSAGSGFSLNDRLNVAATHLTGDGLSIVVEGGSVGGSVYGAGKGINASEKYVPYIFAMNRANDTIMNIPWLSGNVADDYTYTNASSVYSGYAKVNGKISVSIGAGITVGGSVYGGGAYGSVTGNPLVEVAGTVGKDVYGGGRGIYSTDDSSQQFGNVDGNTKVRIVSGAVIKETVYGGGAYGSVTGDSLVEVAGTVGKDVYGGGKGSEDNTATLTFGRINSAVVNIASKGVVKGSVYGGGAYGPVAKSTSVNVSGTVEVDVFGGGMGSSSNTNTGFVESVAGVVITGTVGRNVYGGGAYGNVNIDAGTVTLTVTIDSNAKIAGNVYGGGFGLEKGTAYGRVNCNTDVIINGTVDGSVYGGGAYGIVKRNSSVQIYGGVVTGNVFGGGVGVLDLESVAGSSSVAISGGEVKGNVYGAAELGYVSVNAGISISNGTVTGSVYGAGLGAPPTDGMDNHVSVKENVIVEFSNGTIGGNLFGGSQLALVNGNISILMSGGTVEGTLYGGGYGTITHQSVGGIRDIHICGSSVIDGSVYGGSSRGRDGTYESLNSSAYIYIESGTIRGSVFGGGFQGLTGGKVYIGLGSKSLSGSLAGHFSEKDIDGVLTIGESVYLGGDVGQITAGYKPFSDVLVRGAGELYIDNTKGKLNLSGSIMGSGNSCKTGGSTTVVLRGFADTLDLEAIHRVTDLTIDGSSIVLHGRSTVDENGSELITSTLYSLYGIGSLVLKNASTVTAKAQVENIGEYRSVNDNGDPTQVYSPMNKIVVGSGSTISFRTITTDSDKTDHVTYSSVSGYTIVTVDGSESGFGGYILGSPDSAGGFVVYSKGSFASMDSFDPETNCRCWFLAGTVSNDISLTIPSGGYAETVLSIPKLHADGTVYRYTGGVFVTSSPGERYQMVGETNSFSDKQFNLFFGYSSGADVSYNQLLFGNGVYLRDYSDDVDPVNGSLSKKDGIPNLTLRVAGLFESSKYVGYVIIYLSECSELTYTDSDGYTITTYVAVNNIQIVVNIYSEGSLPSEANVNLPVVNNYGSEVLILPAGKPGYQVEIMKVVPHENNLNNSITKLYIESVKNQDNTLGWTDRLGSKVFYLDGTPYDSVVGTMQGGYVSSLKFTIREYASDLSEQYVVTLALKDPNGNVESIINVTLTISKVPDINVTFKDILQNDGSRLSLTYAFSYGSVITKEDCPPGGTNFIGWYTDEGFNNPYNYSTPLTKDITLYPRYMYVVTLDYMDGTVSTVYVSTDVARIGKLNDPVRNGYTFNGWYTNEAHTGAAWNTESDEVKGNMTLYAFWIGIDVNVRFFVKTDSGYEQLSDNGSPITGTVKFGNRFESGAKLSEAQSVFETGYPNTKFIYWVYKNDVDNAGDKRYAVYSSSYLDDYGKVGWDDSQRQYYLDLIAHTSSVAIKVVLDVSNTGDHSAEVEPPSEFLMFPISDTGNSFEFRVPLNGATRLGYELSGWRLQGSDSPVFSAGSNVNIRVWSVTGTKGVEYWISYWVGNEESSGYKVSISEEVFKTVMGECEDGHGKVVPYEVTFESEWKQIPYAVTIAENKYGTIIATYDLDGTTAHLDGSGTFRYGQNIYLTFKAYPGFEFEAWSATGEGLFADSGDVHTTYTVQSDATIFVYVHGPQIVRVNVQYNTTEGLQANSDSIPALVLLSSDKVQIRLSVTEVILVNGGYLVSYSGIANIGEYEAYLVGPKYGGQYDLGIGITSSTQSNTYQISDGVPEDIDPNHRYNGFVILLKNSIDDSDNGIFSLTELLLQYSGNGIVKTDSKMEMTLNGGYYEYIRSGTVVCSSYADRLPYSEDYGSIQYWEGEVVKQKHELTIDYRYDGMSIKESIGKIGYGEYYWTFISKANGCPDGFAVSGWYLNDVKVDSTTVCQSGGNDGITITANLYETGSRTVKITIQLQNINDDGYMFEKTLTAYAYSDESFSYQLPLYAGFKIKAESNTGTLSYEITQDGMLKIGIESKVEEVTVSYDRIVVEIDIIQCKGDTETIVDSEKIRYGGSLALQRPSDDSENHWGDWVLRNLFGSVIDDVYTVTLQDVLSGSKKAITISSTTPTFQLTLHTQYGMLTQTVNGQLTESDVFIITVFSGSKITWDAENHTVTVIGADGCEYTFDMQDMQEGYALSGWIVSDGTAVSGSFQDIIVKSNLTVSAMWVAKTYEVKITVDQYVSNYSVMIGFDKCTVTDGTITGVRYGSWLTISVIFGAGYTLDPSKLTPNDAKYTRGTTLQQYSIAFYVTGGMSVNISSMETAGQIEIICDGKIIKVYGSADGVTISQSYDLMLSDLVDYIKNSSPESMEGKYVDGWYVNNIPLTYDPGRKCFVIPSVPTEGVKVYCYLRSVTVTGINDIYDGNEHRVTVDINPYDTAYVRYSVIYHYNGINYNEIKLTNINDSCNNKQYTYTVTVYKSYPTSGGVAENVEKYEITGTVDVYLYPKTLLIIGGSTTVSSKEVPSDLDELKKYVVVNGTDRTLEQMGVELTVTMSILYDDVPATSLDHLGTYTLKLSYVLKYKGVDYFPGYEGTCPFNVVVVDGHITVNKTGYSSVIS